MVNEWLCWPQAASLGQILLLSATSDSQRPCLAAHRPKPVASLPDMAGRGQIEPFGWPCPAKDPAIFLFAVRPDLVVAGQVEPSQVGSGLPTTRFSQGWPRLACSGGQIRHRSKRKEKPIFLPRCPLPTRDGPVPPLPPNCHGRPSSPLPLYATVPLPVVR